MTQDDDYRKPETALSRRFKAYEKMAPHRIPRCKTCHLILPCRNDGKYGPCDARAVSHESTSAICDLIKAVFAEPYDGHDLDEKEPVTEREREIADARLVAKRNAIWCKNGHEQTPENTYEGLRKGKYRVWCAVCQKEQYRRKQNEKRGIAAVLVDSSG